MLITKTGDAISMKSVSIALFLMGPPVWGLQQVTYHPALGDRLTKRRGVVAAADTQALLPPQKCRS